MALKVNLDDVLEALELRTRECNHFYYKKTGVVFMVMDDELRAELLYVIRGSGAFRRFKEKIYQYEIEDQWYDYKDQRYKNIAIEWCEENNIDYQDN